MKIKLLGSGCWQGIPAPFCNCDICREASKNIKGKDFRFRTSYLIEKDNKKILVDATPDVRLQTQFNGVENVDAFLITHWHWDHLFGLKDLDLFLSRNKPKIYCSKETKDWLDDQFNYLKLNIEILEPYKEYLICGVKVKPFLVKHTQESFGYLVENRFALLGDYFETPSESLDIINSAETVFLDGTYLEEAIDYDKTHLQKQKIIDFAESLSCKNKVFVSLSCLSKMNHEQLQSKYKKFKISYDGLEFS